MPTRLFSMLAKTGLLRSLLWVAVVLLVVASTFSLVPWREGGGNWHLQSNGGPGQESMAARPEGRWPPSDRPHCCRSGLSVCGSNLRLLGSSLEMYTADHAGRFPTRFSSLVPGYLKQMPTCPASGIDSYSTGYVVSQDRHSYTLTCSGQWHVDVGATPGHPQYTSFGRLVYR